MEIKEDFIPKGRHNRSGIPMNPIYISIHDTGNASEGADAKMHANYLKSTAEMVSWHYTVDDKVIYQHLPLSEAGCSNGDTKDNMKSIGIKICMNEDGNREMAENRAIKLVIYLMKKYNIPLENIYQHNHWSGKDCPMNLKQQANSSYKPSIPKWQIQSFNQIVEKGIINTPESWENRLHKSITVGEMFTILNQMIEYIEKDNEQ